jgi:hypothetical protein
MLAFKICDRFGNGESLEAILAQPSMPEEETFSVGSLSIRKHRGSFV